MAKMPSGGSAEGIATQGVEGWGKSVVEHLAHDLQVDFPGIKGFSAPNLWRMRLLYETYHQNSKLKTQNSKLKTLATGERN